MPFADIDVKNNANVRKGLRAAIFVAPMSEAALTTIMDAAGDLAALPAAWNALGWNNEDGLTWPRETEVSDIFGHGSPEPLRSDVRRSTKRFTVVAQETNIVALEQYLGFSLASVTTSLTDQESSFDEPELPVYPYQRVLAIAKDENDLGEYYMARMFPRARITEVGEETWQDGDTAVQRSLTYTAFFDDTEGTSSRWFLAGPGRDSVAEGFPAPA